MQEVSYLFTCCKKALLYNDDLRMKFIFLSKIPKKPRPVTLT